MVKSKTEKIGLYRKVMAIKELCRIMRVGLLYFIIQTCSSFLIAAFDGLSMALLIPLAKGVIEKDFSFLEAMPFFKIIIDNFPQLSIEVSNTSLFMFLLVIIFMAATLKNVFSYLFRLYISYHKGKYQFRMKQFVFNRYMDFGKLYFDRTSQGYVRQILNFIGQITGLLDILGSMFINIFTGIVYLIIMFAIEWKLVLFIFMVFPALTISTGRLIKRIKKIAQLQTEVSLRLGREVFNILSCINLVKAFNQEEEARKTFGRTNEEMRKLSFSMERKTELIGPIQEMIVLTAFLLIISAVSFIFIKGSVGQISEYIIFFVLARRSIPLFAALNQYRARFAQAEAPVRRVWKVLDDKNKFFVQEGNRVFTGLKNEIEFRHLNFSYFHHTTVLKNLSFSIPKGKTTAIVGPTGAGKTTIISLIMRFYDCPPSTLFVDGTDIREYKIKSLREHIALVSQEIMLFNDTLRNNITFGLGRKISENELIEVVKKARLYDFVMQLPQKFDTEIGDRGVKLSGGERQRVSVARALLRGTDILILDEATSSLDTQTEKLIHEAIEEAVKGMTTIVIAHRLSTIKNADKIIVIEKGKFVEEGSLQYLLDKKGRFYEYWEAQKFY